VTFRPLSHDRADPGLDYDVSRRSSSLDKHTRVDVLRASRMDDDDMIRWHREFEHLSPQAHQDVLASLGIVDDEIADNRAVSAAPCQ